MVWFNYLRFTLLLLLLFVGIGYGSMNENFFTNDEFIMKNGGDEEMICSVTCTKNPNSSPSPQSPLTPSPCEFSDGTTETTSSISDSTFSSSETDFTTPNSLPSICSGSATKTICVSGDPHYSTWDGTYFDYHGTCPHVLVETCTEIQDPINNLNLNFSIKVQNKKLNPIVAVVDSIQFEIYGQKINMNFLGELYVNEQRQYYPYFYPNNVNPQIIIHQNGGSKTIETKDGINILFDGYTLCVSIPDCAPFYGYNKLCGIGGNYDGTCHNDFVFKNSYDEEPTNENSGCAYGNSVSEWANTYITTDYFNPDNSTMECEEGVDSAPCDTTQSKEACKPIFDTPTGYGAFYVCDELNQDLVSRSFETCVTDVCLAPDFLCKAFEDFARLCQRTLNIVNLGDWRTAVGCPAMQCPANSTFGLCGSSCQPSCNDPNPTGCNRTEICMEGCECDYGFVIDNSKLPFGCVKKEDCGCYDDNGIFHTDPNDPWLTKSCTNNNVCWKDKRYTRPFNCDSNEQCLISNGGDVPPRCQSPKCPEGWRYFTNTSSCYKILYEVSYFDAEAQCVEMGSHLVSIHSEAENNFTRDASSMAINTAWTTGPIVTSSIPNTTTSDQTLIGFYHNGTDKWVDNSQMDYTNFMHPYQVNPDNITNTAAPYCYSMSTDDIDTRYGYKHGQWFYADCNKIQRKAVCKKPASA